MTNQGSQNKLMRVLTFNHHEPFLVAMAELPAHFDVVIERKGLSLAWNASARSVPSNFELVDFKTAQYRLNKGNYDVVISHTVKNLVWMFPYFNVRHIFVAHIPLFADTLRKAFFSALKRLVFRAFKLTHNATFVAVSEWKRDSWAQNGYVTPFFPVPFPQNFVATQPSSELMTAVVGNAIVQRGEELGFSLIQAVSAKTPLRIIGNNPDLAGATVPKDFPHFVKLFSECSIYLYTVRRPFGDGYNTSMLEAMLLGMPIVSVPNPSSPLRHNENGLIGNTVEEIVGHIETLRKNSDLREKLGAAARKTVEERFSKTSFLSAWKKALGIHD
ncbi:MAG: glycosyltransferase family 4 protein [Silvanigrellales bacterium]|nr:glycosyltransferase family 4 protein [Silvanigrellales bacterium]